MTLLITILLEIVTVNNSDLILLIKQNWYRLDRHGYQGTLKNTQKMNENLTAINASSKLISIYDNKLSVGATFLKKKTVPKQVS